MFAEIITKTNLYKYRDFIGNEFCNLIGRDYHRALAVSDDECCAAIIWELVHPKKQEYDTISFIRWISFTDNEAADLLFSRYLSICEDEGAELSQYECQLNETEQIREFFERHNYSIHKAESRNVYVTLNDVKQVLELMRPADKDPAAYPLSDLFRYEFEQAIQNIVLESKRDSLKEFAFRDFNEYDPEISCCIVEKGRIAGLLLAYRVSPLETGIELLEVIGDNSKGKIKALINFAASGAISILPANSVIFIRCNDDEGRRMVKALFPKSTNTVYKAQMCFDKS